jgi:hypothetical protein
VLILFCGRLGAEENQVALNLEPTKENPRN